MSREALEPLEEQPETRDALKDVKITGIEVYENGRWRALTDEQVAAWTDGT